MDIDAVAFVFAEPEMAWIEDIIHGVVDELPPDLFGEKISWELVITQYPFIQEFSVAKAMEKIYKTRSKKLVSDEPYFPKDNLESENNFKQFIDRRPVRVMLIGDSDPSIFELGELVAKKFGTYQVTPKKLLERSIMMQTPIGKWLFKNIKEKQAVPIWVIMKLLELELKKDKYTHKGFLLTGFPMVPDLISENNVTTEHRDDENDWFKSEEYGMQEDTGDISSSSNSTLVDFNVSIHKDIFKDILHNNFVRIDGHDKAILNQCVVKYLNVIKNSSYRPDYIIFIQNNSFTKPFSVIIDAVEDFILSYNKENVIQIDGRIGLKYTFRSICNRFKYINYKVNYECLNINIDGSNAMSLKEMCNIEKPVSNCRWWFSEFGRMCPVSLFNGRRRICGNSFAVRYLRYIFLCYSAKERMTFTLNPGKYLNVFPTCRVAVIGPHRSGKTTLSEYLAQYFKADIYRHHIHKAGVFMNNINMKDFMDKSVKKELKELDALRIHEYELNKQRKTEEWTTCVLSVVNDIFTKALGKGNKAQTLNIFSRKQAVSCYQWLYNLPMSDTNIKTLILQNSIFNKSMQTIDQKEFLDWVSTKPQTHHTYRQYILDSAPLDIYFWEALSLNDEMPDCVFFLHTWSMEKMSDLYSLSHDETCVDGKFILQKICESFNHWKGRFELNFQHPKNIGTPKMRMDDSTRKYIKHLISNRYKESINFMDKYVELQSFFQQHNVKCINIDISQKSITQSVLQAILAYLSVYQAQPLALYDYYLQNPNFIDVNENEENSFTSNSSLEVRDMENVTESHLLSSPSISTYGNYLDWCPVILERHNVLLKGKNDYAAEYKNKHYLMHSREALCEFMSKASYFSLKKPVPPPPRIFFAGLCHMNKINFTENLANCLNVKHISYIQNLAKMKQNVYINQGFSIQTLKDSYQRNREEIIQDLAAVFKRGVVIVGYPLFLEQFNDAVSNNLFPEYVFIFNDHEEVLHSMYNNLARLHIRNSLLGSRKVLFESRGGSITSEIESLPESIKQDIQKTCKFILQSFLEEHDKIEEACSKLNIQIIKIQNNYKKPGIVKHYVEHINQNRDRIAIFENVQEITLNDSKILLNSGYYRYSRFKRSCPVDVSRLITINHFEGTRTQECIYPCIYSDFIYFLNGKLNLESFKRNPLEFVNTCNPPQMQEPMRIAVFGPPKSGVTGICRALSQKFGCKIFSQKDISTKSITDSAIIDFLLMNNSITPNGLILDNFPLTPKLLLDAARHTVHFCAVFIIISSFEKNLENCLRHSQKLKNCPRLLLAEFCRKFCETFKIIRSFRMSTEISLFNIHYLDGDANSWLTLEKVKDELIKTARCSIGYGVKLRKARCATLGHLALFYDNVVLNRKINHFYCQVCLSIGKLNAFKYYYVNVKKEFYSDECQQLLNRPFGYMNDEIYENFNFRQPFHVNELYEPLATQKKFAMSLNQFRDVFYWVCYDHSIEFLTHTQQYHNDCDRLKPLYIPFLVVAYTKDFVAFQGYCPVEYERHKLVKGLMNLSVYYRKKVYLLSSKENALTFLSYPEKYRKLKFDPNLCTGKDIKSFHGLSEKTLSVQLLELINVRPKHFKLNGKQSATTFLALKLKTCCSEGIINDYWKTAFRSFVADCHKLDEELKRYQENINPYILVPVPDERFDFLCEYHKPASKVPAYLNVVDIAGLVKGAAEGQGLGNAFLSHISACDAIFHLCRAFEDPDVTHVEGEVDPVRDLDIICEELRLKDEEKLLQNLDKLEKVVARGGDKKLKPEYDSLSKIKTILIDEKKHLRFADWNAHDIETLNKYMFLTSKPMIYLVNLSDKDFIRKKNKWLAKIKEWVDKNDPGATIIPFSGHFENDLAEKDESERKLYEEETKCKSVLDKIIVTGYKALQLEYFFTAGPDEVKAWTIQKGTKAPQAAGRIHTDFEKGFIMAEVMHYKDFKEEGSEAAAKSAGKYRQQGRNYVVEDGDIIFFKFNAGAGLKDAKKK